MLKTWIFVLSLFIIKIRYILRKRNNYILQIILDLFEFGKVVYVIFLIIYR